MNEFRQIRDRQIGKHISFVSMSQLELSGTNIDVYIHLYRHTGLSMIERMENHQSSGLRRRLAIVGSSADFRAARETVLSVQRRQRITCNRTPASNCRDVREMEMTDR